MRNGSQLANGVDQCRVTDEQVALGFYFFGRGVVGKVGIAEAALDGRGLDGLSANRAGFAVWVHDRHPSR